MNMNLLVGIIAFLLFCLNNKCLNTEIFKDFNKGRNSLSLNSNHSRDILLSDSCKKCHTNTFNEWKDSFHHQSYTNKTFLQALQREPREWCINCHAPLWERDKIITFQGIILIEPENTLFLKEGINCATCHIRNNKILTANKIKSSVDCILPLEYNQELGSHKLCESCHQFNFTESNSHQINFSSSPIQNTIEEFKNSYWFSKGYECQHCHFKDGNHNQNNPHSDKSLRENLGIQIKFFEKPDFLLKINLKFDKIGHNFPTGDLFRQIKIEVFSKTGKILVNHKIRKIFNIIEKKLIFDNTLKIDKSQKGIDHDLWFQLQSQPKICRVSYQFQNILDSNHFYKTTQSFNEIILYDGSCNK